MCWTCWENKCWCKEIVYWVCGLIAWNWIDVKDITQIWECCKVYEIKSIIDIISSDNSIDISKTWNVFDIKQKNKDTDKLVSVNSADTPWYLVDKIKSLCNNILTISPTEVSANNRVLNMCIDPSKINVPDKKVAAKDWCPSKYLSEIMVTNHTPYFVFEENSCNVNLKVTPQKLFFAEVNSNQMYISPNLWANTTWFWTIDPSYFSSNSTEPTYVQNIPVSWANTSNTIWFVVPRDWWFTTWFGWSATVGSWVHTLRSQVLWFKATWWQPIVLLDDRFEWWQRKDNSNDDILSLSELWVLHVYNDNSLNGNGWDSGSLARGIRWHWFGQSRLKELKAWDKIIFAYKRNTELKEQWTLDNTIAYTNNWVDSLTWWTGSWVFMRIKEEVINRICK